MAYTIKAVADLASVTIRTLHYYDHIGLLKPASMSPSGYRLYVEADLERLQQILMGKDPADPEVQKRIGQHFRLINDRFYTCTPQIYRGLGDLYVSDSRFTAHYDEVRPGLAEFMRAAMHAYCDRLEQLP